ncbi:hypothetical protein [Amycolatopsis sp. NPDC051102]|uniref:hypothetical protein n=1 Tax=Amycolatopsis sp. NPDC051102 TaxID=3155163 RepID=UPI003425E64B
MNEDELLGHLGELIGFTRHGSRHRGRLLELTWSVPEGGDREVYVTVELPCTLLKVSLPARDVTHVEAGDHTIRRGSSRR